MNGSIENKTCTVERPQLTELTESIAQKMPNKEELKMLFYEASRNVPIEAQKAFNNGRFSGTDINPMWRIKKLTELFGPCGFGWYYTIDKQWLDEGSDGVKTANVIIHLYVNYNGIWSMPIAGIGGNTFISKTAKGLQTSDECYKMALTDAISVASKALGIGADIYFAADRTKYSQTQTESTKNTNENDNIDWWKTN